MARDRQIVIKSQFNINGSRGGSVQGFITDYVSRDAGTNVSMAYVNPREIGDGVSFTLSDTAISRQETLAIAEQVETHFQTGKRAIQQLVISFDHDYLVENHIVDGDTSVLAKGDYKEKYDDVMLRHAIRQGVQYLIDQEGYRDAKMIGALQDDTTHLHAHIVIYEDADVARLRGREEKGVVKESSFEACVRGIDAYLKSVAKQAQTPEKLLTQSVKVEVVEPLNTQVFDEYQQLLIQMNWLQHLQENEKDEDIDRQLEQ